MADALMTDVNQLHLSDRWGSSRRRHVRWKVTAQKFSTLYAGMESFVTTLCSIRTELLTSGAWCMKLRAGVADAKVSAVHVGVCRREGGVRPAAVWVVVLYKCV